MKIREIIEPHKSKYRNVNLLKLVSDESFIDYKGGEYLPQFNSYLEIKTEKNTDLSVTEKIVSYLNKNGIHNISINNLEKSLDLSDASIIHIVAFMEKYSFDYALKLRKEIESKFDLDKNNIYLSIS